MLRKLLKSGLLLSIFPFIFLPVNAENLDIEPKYPNGSIYVTANEGWGINYEAPEGYSIESILFASYGTPVNYQLSNCNSENSLDIVNQYVTNKTIYIVASNGIFGDPCPGIYKRLSIVLTISQDMESPSPTPTILPTEEPTETPSPTVTESTLEPTNSGSPTNPEPTVLPTEPSVYPSPTQSTPVPESSFSQLPTMQPTLIVPSEIPSPSVTNITIDNNPNDITEEDLNQLVELPNGVVLTKEVAESIKVFDSPQKIISTILTNPKKIFTALSNVGADLPPEKRKTAQQAIFPMIIVGQIASATMSLLQRRI